MANAEIIALQAKEKAKRTASAEQTRPGAVFMRSKRGSSRSVVVRTPGLPGGIFAGRGYL